MADLFLGSLVSSLTAAVTAGHRTRGPRRRETRYSQHGEALKENTADLTLTDWTGVRGSGGTEINASTNTARLRKSSEIILVIIIIILLLLLLLLLILLIILLLLIIILGLLLLIIIFNNNNHIRRITVGLLKVKTMILIIIVL